MTGMQLISGCAVEVLRRSTGAVDAHGNEVPSEWVSEPVANVLPQPGATSDLDSSRPNGVTVSMTFHFPKTYTASLRGCLIRYGGREYPVIGDPQTYLDANCPGEWNRPVECGVCDG